ncbi:SMP-30/gluconolactonase/LRE family protein [Microbulbifer agarilyticus]|uniref:SMP-30/gluconolactonase/LRE family protein n=1 Tax=Microbulbifer agarilyticus TaxID=260552 RepID=UPI001C98AEF9|nr:SMP-30/gluconolactonase/LRE family protein [Microbulbifer agarilyticus]MBY6212042.1 SMP-30/gluconolactonase/LRE family protein [Microbulbifer agarilyticus]
MSDQLLNSATREQGGETVAAEVFDERICSLGEGPLWHPLRKTLYWVDLLNNKVLAKGPDGTQAWDVGEMPSAIGWVDRDRALVACESGLHLMDLNSGEKSLLCELEPDMPGNRSNDGRADPWGGFWIGTMGINGEPDQGNLYRWYKGELRRLDSGMTVPNGICFDRERCYGYYADSAKNTVYRVLLNTADGWPMGEPEVFLDLSTQELIPDGAVMDGQGNMWTSLWDSARTQCFDPSGREIAALEAPVIRTTCPAFGGEDFTDMYVTTAAVGLEDRPGAEVANGVTLVYRNAVQGRPEPAVIV